MTATGFTCPGCGDTATHHARGLCRGCYRSAERLGTLDQWAPTTYARPWEAEATRRINAGDPIAVIARALGVPRSTIGDHAKRHGLRHDKQGIVKPGTNAWPTTEHGDPPTRPVCAGTVMDFDGLQPTQLTPSRNAWVAEGLARCAVCPLATRQWCLDVMDPTGLGVEWQGIAGGVVWSHGRVVFMPAELTEAAS
jgi:hypothetical protein